MQDPLEAGRATGRICFVLVSGACDDRREVCCHLVDVKHGIEFAQYTADVQSFVGEGVVSRDTA